VWKFGDAIELYWDQRKYQRTIRLSIASNVGLFKSHFHAFSNEIGNKEPLTPEENLFYCMPSTEVSETSDLDPDGTGGEGVDGDIFNQVWNDYPTADILTSQMMCLLRSNVPV
jgi:hypothetical protein